jgi:predicted ATPase
MITLIEAKNFRCLRYIHQPLGPFHVLVGPNASGKTTFLDIIAFLGQLVSDDLEKTVYDRTHNFKDLIWGREGDGFELAIEATIPEERRALLKDKAYDTIRYEISLGIDKASDEFVFNSEKVILEKKNSNTGKKTRKFVVKKNLGSNDIFFSEKYHQKRARPFTFKLGPRKSALGNLPEDESKFPVSTWLKRFLNEGIQQFTLNSLLMRKPSPPGQVRRFQPDGSNLPWVVDNLYNKHPEKFKSWIRHLQTALPDIENIKTIERPEDKHRYLMLCYRGGLEVPSWMASDGTLRLLALTLPAYLPDLTGVYLIEEPENGIHPRAVETAYQSLSSVYNAQVLMATHSPVILGMVEADKVLCFAKTPTGETEIVRGSDHPNLKNWKGETNLGTLFAGGVLG